MESVFWFLLKNLKMGVILLGKHVKPTLSTKLRQLSLWASINVMNCNYISMLSCLFTVATPYHVILCNFRLLFYSIYISVNSWYLNKPDEDWYWPVEISQLNSISRCLISPCKRLLDCNAFNLICFDWSRSFWIRRWARFIVHGFCSGFFTLILHCNLV